MAKLVIKNDFESTEIDVPDTTSIRDVCEENGIPMACMEGICGTCIVNVEEGMENLSEKSEAEIDFFGEDPSPERLACQCRIKSGKVVVKS